MASPFDSGKTLVFKAFSQVSNSGDKRYLDAWALRHSGPTVYLSETLDFTTNMGCHWEAKKVGDNVYTLKTMSAGDEKPCYLADMSSRNPDLSNNLADLQLDGRSGPGLSNNPDDAACHWRVDRGPNGTYIIQCESTKAYLDSRPEDGTVFLLSMTTAVGIGSWEVGVDYYTGQEIRKIMNQTYPNLNVQYYADLHYMALDLEDLCRIWKNESALDQSSLGSYRWKRERFDCDDFAVCLKAQVAKYSYNQSFGKGGSLCGIVWGRNDNSAHAFNFTVDRFGKLILFEPQTGYTIDTNAWNPYFCMV